MDDVVVAVAQVRRAADSVSVRASEAVFCNTKGLATTVVTVGDLAVWVAGHCVLSSDQRVRLVCTDRMW